MGLANLVPGISGGTMILAMGLYDAFIGAVADVTRLRITRQHLTFLGVMVIGVGIAVVTLSGVAVTLVASHRWVMYSLFIGLTLGGVPDLLRLSRPLAASTAVAFAMGLAGMAALAWGLSGTSLPTNAVVLTLVGAAAASSMILPGVSGSYVLLILGMYDTVIGSLSAGELKADPGGALSIILPVVAGAALGIALLANLLKALLARWSGPSHGALLGLLCGSVFGLYPFRDAVHPDLSDRGTRKAIEALVVEGLEPEAVRAEHGEDLTTADLEAWREDWEGKSKGELKRASLELETFPPGGGRIALACALLALGFVATRALGAGATKGDGSDG
jgi:putative membrane protein